MVQVIAFSPVATNRWQGWYFLLRPYAGHAVPLKIVIESEIFPTVDF